jgi:hypothetical protein
MALATSEVSTEYEKSPASVDSIQTEVSTEYEQSISYLESESGDESELPSAEAIARQKRNSVPWWQILNDEHEHAAISKAPLVHPRREKRQKNLRYLQADGRCRVFWSIDARSFRNYHKYIFSPLFTFSCGNGLPDVTLKMTVNSSHVNFKKSNGCGLLALVCETASLPSEVEIMFRVSMGEGPLEDQRGPVAHDFASGATCGLPSEVERWDFPSYRDRDTKIVTIRVDIVAGGADFSDPIFSSL